LNVKGPYTQELNLLFGGLARDLRESADLIATRISSHGGYAVATIRGAARWSHLHEYPPDALDVHEHLRALLSSYSRYEFDTQNTMKAMLELGDSEAHQLLQEICSLINRHLWLLEAYLEGTAIGINGAKLPKWTPAIKNDPLSRHRDERLATFGT
jgi:DNA-binding ferritin-like protein